MSILLRGNIALCFVFSCFFVHAQVTLNGKLVDVLGKGITGASIAYKKIGSTAILGFTKSNERGDYQLVIKINQLDSVQLDFSHLSYARKSVIVPNQNATFSHTLIAAENRLKEVKVVDLPITRRKDTLNFHVESFTGKRDRVIGDIIKKLPGIEMDGNQILYQGKPIQQYKVNDLDLMGGRYGMINQNLPAEAVIKVQILENHQPIKMLDTLVFSNRATLNLVLKKFTTSGTAKIGIGVSPLLWDVAITPMTFGKTFQMLNSLQTNNIGDDISEQLQPFYSGYGYFTARSNFSKAPTFLDIRGVTTPDFDQKRWLNNRIFLVSSNMLQKLDNDVEFKGNFSYFHDNRKVNGSTTTQYFSGGQTISNQEVINNGFGIDELNLGLLIEKNERNVYLRNSASYRKRWNNSTGDLLFNVNTPIQQQKRFSDEAFLNSLSLARFLGKQLINIRSTIEWHNTPQRLSVSPGQFESLLNDGKPYERMGQLVQYRSFSFQNGISFMRKVKGWTISPDISLNYNHSNLDTQIEINENGLTKNLDEGYLNDIDNSQLQLGLNVQINRETPRLKYLINLPFNQYYYNIKQQEVQTLKNVYRNTWNPRAELTYLISSNNNLIINLNGGREYGGLDNFYNGYIIRQYRNIQRYDARLLKNDKIEAELAYAYKNTLKARFANFSYNYNKNWRDYMFATILDSLGRTTNFIDNQHSQNRLHRVRAELSQFFTPIKTVAKLTMTTGWNISDYLLNDQLVQQHVNSQSLSFELINTLSGIISGDYSLSIGRTQNLLANNQSNELRYDSHIFNLILTPFHGHLFTLSNSLYSNNLKGQKSQYFMDATYRYSLDKWKIDFEFRMLNLLDNRNYLQQFSSDYQLIQSYFTLRPRQALLSVKFRFK